MQLPDAPPVLPELGENWEPDYVPDQDSAKVVKIRPDVDFVEVSEDAIASSFTRTYGHEFRFDHHIGKWFQWSQTHWRRLEIPIAFHFARLISRDLSGGKRAMCKAAVARGAEAYWRGATKALKPSHLHI